MVKTTLKEFFQLGEGPRDPAFKPAAEVPVGAGLDAMDPAAAELGDDTMTQDVAPLPTEDLNFFAKNVQSAVSKYNLETEGFDSSGVQAFAEGLDQFVLAMYANVQSPNARQGFEVDYQKIAADWSKDLTKLFEKVLKLSGHADQI